MLWQLTLNSLILGAAAGLALAIATIMRARPAARASRTVFWLLVAIAIWAGADALESAAVPIPLKIWWAKASYLGIAAVPPLWFLFTLEYGQRDGRLRRRDRRLLWAMPLLTILLAATNEWHQLIWSRIVPAAPAPGAELIYYHGPWFWLAVIFSYSLIAAGTLILLRAIGRFPQHYHGQSALLLLAAGLPWAGNLLYLAGWRPAVGLDPTPVTFLLSGLAFAVGLVRYRMLDLVPIARDVLIEAMGDAVIVMDTRGRVVDLNPAACRLLGLRPPEAIGQAAARVLADWPDLARRLPATLELAGEVRSREQPPRVLDAQSVALLDQAGRPGGALLLLRDVTASRRAESELRQAQALNERILEDANRQLQAQLAATEALQAELREQAIRDPLTGLYNRRYLQESLDREVARAARAGHPISVVILDIDHFKQLNDLSGHEAGDRMLRALGEILRADSRQEDIACRLGGDEFVVMLGGASPEVAASRAGAWCEAFRGLNELHDDRPLRATLSAGIAGFPAHATSGAALLQSADRALYQAKAEGRDCVSVLRLSEEALHHDQQ